MLKLTLLTAFCILAVQAIAQDDELLAWGKVLDARTHKGIEANIRYSSIPTGSITGKFNDSTFSFPIFGTAKYQVTAEAQGYNPKTIIINPKDIDTDKRILRDIRLSDRKSVV